MLRSISRHLNSSIGAATAVSKPTAAPNDLAEVCRQLEIAESTWHRWKAQYGGMKVNDAKRLKELETEKGRLKRIVADLTLDNAMLKEVAKGNF